MHRRRSTCSEYFDNSNIHGLRYLTKSDRSWVERLWWLAMILSALYGCTRYISTVYVKWQTSPLIVSIAETAMPIREIPFPAVTICPQAKSKANIFNLTYVFQKMTKQNMSLDVLTEIE
jgi:acid-sensing ion channel, other